MSNQEEKRAQIIAAEAARAAAAALANPTVRKRPRPHRAAPPSGPPPSRRSSPLRPDEITGMKQHLGFFPTHKGTLRLPPSAAEDLLVKGQGEPSAGGVCRHLLAKLDRAAIEGVLGREPLRSDPAARAHFLAGAL